MKVKNIMFSGFMAVILMGVAGNASAAVQIASKAYVDGELASKASTTDLTNVQNTLQAAIDDKASQTYVGTIPEGATATSIVGYVQEKTSGIASQGAMTELTNRVGIAEGKVTTLEGKMTTAESDIDTLQGDMTTAQRDITSLQSAMTGNGEGSVAAKISSAITGLDLANTYETKGEAAKVQANVNTLSETVAGKAAASDLTALDTRVTAAEGEIDTLQSEMDAVEAKAAANTTAIEGKVAQTAYDTKMSELDAAIAEKFKLPEGCTGEGANCVLSSIGGSIQWVDITAPLQ